MFKLAGVNWIKLLCYLLPTVTVVALIVFAYVTLRPIQQIYAETEFEPAVANRLVFQLRSGLLKVPGDGEVALPPDIMSCSKNGCAYVTHDSKKMLVLLPSYLDHDTSDFLGYLYDDSDRQAFSKDKKSVTLTGPTRAVLHGPRTRTLLLKIGDKVDSKWYKVYGQWH